MTKFYTNVVSRGDNILVRGYDNGQPFKQKIPYTPTLYLYSTKKDTTYKTLFGESVDEIKFDSVAKARAWTAKYADVEGCHMYGNTKFDIQYISDTYRNDVPWVMDSIKIFTIDIETETEYGFPDIDLANERILLITVKDSVSKSIVTFGFNQCNNTHATAKYILCADEEDMLRKFMLFWQANYPDVITGWNVVGFDIPYMTRRIERVLGETTTKKLSPWGIVQEKKYKKQKEEDGITFSWLGVSVLDYIELYQKFTYVKQESYKLDFIAEVELDRNKVENPYSSFKEFYTKDFSLFVQYNIIDVELVDALEDKLKLIDLALTMAYNAKINYQDVYSPVKMWDSLVYNHLRKTNRVIPYHDIGEKTEKFKGAFVKDPVTGFHKYIVSFDATALYPSIMQGLNISPETYLGTDFGITVDNLISRSATLTTDTNRTLAASGAKFSNNKIGMFGELIDVMSASRRTAKNQMLGAQQELENLTTTDPDNDTEATNIKKKISSLDNQQKAAKYALNSLYGACGTPYFRYFNLDIARAITLTGQFIIQSCEQGINKKLNDMFGTTDYEYCFYCDTDSLLIRLNPMVEKYMAGWDKHAVITAIEKFCKEKLSGLIGAICADFQKYLNFYRDTIVFKLEVVADAGIFKAKKKYILNVYSSEGVRYAKPKHKIMGMSMIQSSTPAVVREKLKESVDVFPGGDESELHNFVAEYQKEFNLLNAEAIAFPRGVNGIKKYAGLPIYAKGTPIGARAALLHNHHVKKLGLAKKYQAISDGDKIKFVYVKMPNPSHEDVIGFADKLPTEFNLHSYIDYDTQFNKTFVAPLQALAELMGWNAKPVATLDSFFG